MALLTKRIEASTLVESLIAMVVVMVSFGVATTVYVNVMSSGNEMQKLKARTLLQKLAVETKQERLFLDTKMTMDGFVVDKKVVAYNSQKHLFLLKLTAYSATEKQLAVYNELIQTEQ